MSAVKYDLIVIGSGPAGQRAAGGIGVDTSLFKRFNGRGGKISVVRLVNQHGSLTGDAIAQRWARLALAF